MGRNSRFRDPMVFSILFYIYSRFTSVASSDYGLPVEIKIWNNGRSPLAHMVDVTNEFGLKVLAEHNFLNDNNIAFSPYGLMGILVALFEGVDGESSYQLQRGIQLPWNRNTLRIGFRDIHRTLKTYFVPEEGFLAGLALNNENVTFTDSYKRLLRYYGFDLENDQLPKFPPQGSNTTEVTTTKSSTIDNATSAATAREDTSTTITMTTESKPREELTTHTQETTTNRIKEILADVDIREPATSNTNLITSTSNAGITTQNTIVSTTTEQASTVTLTATEATEQSTLNSNTTPLSADVSSTTTEMLSSSSTTEDVGTPTTTEISNTLLTRETPDTLSTTEILNSQLTANSTTENSITSTTVFTSIPEVDAETISQQTSQATVSLIAENGMEVSSTAEEMISSTEQTLGTESTPITSTITNTDNTQTDTMMTPSSLETQQTNQPDTSTMTTLDSTTLMMNDSALETLERRKKSIVDFIFGNPPYMDDLLYRSFDIPLATPEPNFNNKHFMANGLKSIQVTYMHYDTFLEYAYLPHLEASALRLPLDSDRYYLLVVLPLRGGASELGRLLARMARESDLSDIYGALRPRRVKGIVPSFTVKGHVTLTTDLQKLGIRNVFEPRQRDFSPMTRQTGVYVRSIEQAVSVAIRKYQPDDLKKNRYVTIREPVKFYATYPFLYFVMDANIHVALMAGKMVDPLNTRIL